MFACLSRLNINRRIDVDVSSATDRLHRIARHAQSGGDLPIRCASASQLHNSLTGNLTCHDALLLNRNKVSTDRASTHPDL
ncbi:hypothetical protein HMPREF9570_00542 [Cutibacterium acnes HL043PA1]|nr:hypothetical protein HMPREF9570_00542 [Cutibacterium acnes HL043PA1]